MVNDLTRNSSWTLITINDPSFLSGNSIHDVIQLLLKVIKFKFTVVEDVNGSGKDWVVSSLQKKKNVVIDIEDFLKILHEVNQFDWGDFFLFKEYPKNWINTHELSYPEIIFQTDTTVRAVDNQYIYIYTPFLEIVDVIKKTYEIESIRTDLLENLDYPY